MKKSDRYIIIVLIGLVIFTLTLLVFVSRGSLPDLIFQKKGDCQVSINSFIPDKKVRLSDKKAFCAYLDEWGVFENDGYSYESEITPRNTATISELQVNLYDEQEDFFDFQIVESIESGVLDFATKRKLNGSTGIVEIYIRPEIISSENIELRTSWYLLRALYLTNVVSKRSYSADDLNTIKIIGDDFMSKDRPFVEFD